MKIRREDMACIVTSIPHTLIQIGRKARRADDSHEHNWYGEAAKTHVPAEDDFNVLIRRMCDKGDDPALAEVTFDDNGMFNDDEIFSIL